MKTLVQFEDCLIVGKCPTMLELTYGRYKKKLIPLCMLHLEEFLNFMSYSVVGPSFVLNHVSEILCSFYCLVTMVTVILTVGLFECVPSS